MRKFTNLSFDDFIYKDQKLSDLGGYVGSADGGLKTYPLLPTREYVVDRPLGSNVTTVYASSLAPRPFEVPIVFEELHDDTIRELAYWLDSPTPSKFQWVGDDVYINACLDSNDFSVASSSGTDGQIILKFIGYDPFYYDINQTQYTVTSLTSGKVYTYNNAGYGDLEPQITIACNGWVKLEVLDASGAVYTTTNITDITGGVTIDSKTMECTLLSGASHFHKIDKFPYLPHGQFSIRVSGDALSNMSLVYTQKYI